MVVHLQKTTYLSTVLLICTVSLASFMASLDGAIVNIILPTISGIFDISMTDVSWVLTIYLLVMAGAILICGKIADTIGFRRIFLIGFSVFTIGSFACGFLPMITGSYVSLLAGRVIQAAGGAMMMAIGPAILSTFLPLEKRGKALGVLMTVCALGTALGPIVGGLLTQYLSWEWIFYINVPVGIAAILLGIVVIPTQNTSGTDISSFDKYGAALIFLGMATLLYSLSQGVSAGWTHPVIFGSFALAVIALAGFAVRQLRYSEPLFDLRLFKNHQFSLVNLVLVLMVGSYAGTYYLLPFFLQEVRGLSVSVSGVLLTALPIGMTITGFVSGLLYNRFGGKKLCIAGSLLLIAGYYPLWHMSAAVAAGYVAAALFVFGLGVGLMLNPLVTMMLTGVEKNKQGMVSSLASLEQSAPVIFSVAIYNAVLVWGISLAAAGSSGEAIAQGYNTAFFCSFILAAGIFVLSLFLRPEVHPDHLEMD